MRKATNGGHRKMEKLTARPIAMAVTSEKAPTAWVDGGGDVWRDSTARVRANPTKT